jgi:hypothetical protein
MTSYGFALTALWVCIATVFFNSVNSDQERGYPLLSSPKLKKSIKLNNNNNESLRVKGKGEGLKSSPFALCPPIINY